MTVCARASMKTFSFLPHGQESARPREREKSEWKEIATSAHARSSGDPKDRSSSSQNMGEAGLSDAEDGKEAVGSDQGAESSSSSSTGEKQKNQREAEQEKMAIICQCSSVLDPFTPKENAR